jgi:hypothetical protein
MGVRDPDDYEFVCYRMANHKRQGMGSGCKCHARRFNRMGAPGFDPEQRVLRPVQLPDPQSFGMSGD